MYLVLMVNTTVTILAMKNILKSIGQVNVFLITVY